MKINDVISANSEGKIDLEDTKNKVAPEIVEMQKRELQVMVFGLSKNDKSTIELWIMKSNANFQNVLGKL